MSTNGQLVFTDVDKITFKGVGNASNAVIDTLTGKIGVGVDSPDANLHVVGNSYVSTNLELGGTLIMGTVNVEAQHSLEAVTATGNTTPLTIEFTNPTTSLVASGNVVVTGNVTADHFVGDGSNITGISSTLQAITDSGNVTSNTVQFSNATTGFVTTANVEVGGELTVSNILAKTTLLAHSQQKVVSNDRGSQDNFGKSVSISGDGNFAVVGAHQEDEDVSGSSTLSNAGAAYIYKYNGSTWSQVQKIVASDRAVNTQFGWSVSISNDGNSIVIGAVAESMDASGSNQISAAGAAYIFTYNGSAWVQIQKVVASDRATYDFFGKSVSISGDGNTFAVGADAEDEDESGANTLSGSGSVYIFTRDTANVLTSTWSQQKKLVATDRSAGAYFGSSLSVSSDGQTILVGAYGESEDVSGANTLTLAGAAYIFTYSGSTWTQKQKIVASNRIGDGYFGWGVSISKDGNVALIGEAGITGTGAAYTFTRDTLNDLTSSWTFQQKLVSNDITSGDAFGKNVSLSNDGNVAIISANGNGTDESGGNNISNAGAAYIFSRNGTTWSQIKKIVASDRTSSDNLSSSSGEGTGVSISSNGNKAIVGAALQDTDESGANNLTNAGAAYIFLNLASSQSNLNIDGNAVVTTANVEVGGELTVSGNVVVDTNTLFVDSVNNRVGIGGNNPDGKLHVFTSSGDANSTDNALFIGGPENCTGIPNLRLGCHQTPNYAWIQSHCSSALCLNPLGGTNVGIWTSSPIAALDIDGGPENDTVPALSIRGGLYDTSDLYVLNTYNVNTGVGYAAKVIGVNIKNKVETDNTVQLRNNVGGLTSAGAIYLGSDNTNQGVFGVLTCQGSAGTTLTEKFTITDSGNVGIGTTNPNTKLHVEHYGSQIGDFEGIRIANHATNLHASSRPAYEFVVSDINSNTGIGNGKFAIGYRGNTSASRTDRLVIDNSGRVGIGTTSPSTDLQIGNTTDKTSDTYLTIASDGGSAYAQGIKLIHHDPNYGWRIRGDDTDDCFHINYISAGSNNASALTISNSGNVGVGTTTPYAKLHVNGGSGAIAIGWRKYFKWNDPNQGSSGLAGQSGHGWGTHSIYASEAIICGHYFVSAQGAISSSDERIKKDIVDAEDGKALDIIRLLKPKKYRYKDEINRGVEPVWGFIAQEVNDILPEAIKIDEECLPNIYEMANVSTSNVITFTNFDTSTLESNASVIKVYDTKEEEHLITLNEVIDEHTIRVEEDLSEWIGSLDETGNVIAGTQLFVYGQRVNDFHRIRKETVWTVATAALQEVDRQLQAEKVKVASLETQLTSVLARLDALENA